MTGHRAKGFSLVELMVALTLSMVITSGVAMVWVSNRQTFLGQDNRSRMQENGRFALSVIEREVRLAGYKGLGNEGLNATYLFGTTPALSGANDTLSVVVGGSVALTTDTLTVSFYGAGTGATGDGTVTNCFGTGIAAGTQVVDSFYAAVDATSGLPSLFCSSLSGGTTTTAVLAYSIETLQVLYGEETDGAGTGIPNHFVQSGVVANFGNVTQVRVSLLVRGEDRTVAKVQGISNSQRVSGTTAPYGQTFYHFGTTYSANDTTGDSGAASSLVAVADGRQRTLFTTSVALRNRLN